MFLILLLSSVIYYCGVSENILYLIFSIKFLVFEYVYEHGICACFTVDEMLACDVILHAHYPCSGKKNHLTQNLEGSTLQPLYNMVHYNTVLDIT